jgi:hypothetical protein
MPKELRELNYSTAGQNAALFQLEKIPGIEFFCTGFTLPAISTDPITIFPPQFAPVSTASHKALFGDLSITFNVSEDFKEYFAIAGWIEKNCFSVFDAEFKSNGSMIIHDNHKKPIAKIFFTDLHPSSLSEIQFNMISPDPISATLVLRMESYRIEKIAERF